MSADLTHGYIRSWVDHMLGGSGRAIELEESDYLFAIKTALRRINKVRKRKTYTRETSVSTAVTSDSSHTVELDSDVIDVIDVDFLVPEADRISDIDPFSQHYYDYTGVNSTIDFVLTKMHHKTLLNSRGATPTWEYDQSTHTLHIFAPGGPYDVSILEVRNHASPAQLLSDYDDIFLRIVLRYIKEALGRIRNKYGDSLSGPAGETQLDGSTLLQESQAEEDKLVEELKFIADTPPPIIG